MLREARARRAAGDRRDLPALSAFCAEEIPDGATLRKCAPPIRSRENREKLWQALREGVIDLVATDHSPCPPAMKQLEDGNFERRGAGSRACRLRCR